MVFVSPYKPFSTSQGLIQQTQILHRATIRIRRDQHVKPCERINRTISHASMSKHICSRPLPPRTHNFDHFLTEPRPIIPQILREGNLREGKICQHEDNRSIEHQARIITSRYVDQIIIIKLLQPAQLRPEILADAIIQCTRQDLVILHNKTSILNQRSTSPMYAEVGCALVLRRATSTKFRIAYGIFSSVSGA